MNRKNGVLNMAMRIIRSICTACGDCIRVCPTQSISKYKGVYQINPNTCSECTGEGEAGSPQCVRACFESGCIVPA